MKIIDFLQKQSQIFVITLGIIFIVLISALDFITGPELSFSLFYLIPIALVAWWGNERKVGIFAAVVASICWLIVDLSGSKAYSSSVIPYWNAGVRGGTFLIVALTLSSLHVAGNKQEELAHFIIHDLRSPLSNALAGLQLLEIDFSDDTQDPAHRELIQLSVASCNRMMTLINSLLDLAKLESRQLKVALQQTDVQELFDAALQQVSALAFRNEVGVECQVDTGAQRVLADAELTVRVLVNLVSNALKYSPKNTTILVRAVLRDNGEVALSVTDRGAGIPKEWSDKVFSKFTQIEARRAGMAVGSGLGLTFCRMAVEAQGGHIWVASDVGQGTTMTFTLPCR